MNAQCAKCGAEVSPLWKFCPICGATVDSAPAPAAPSVTPPSPAERAPVSGAFGGLLFGMLVVPILAIVGTMLCLTGLGAFLGVPMIAAAILAPLLGPLLGIRTLHGHCPWCGVRIDSILKAQEFYCHACSKKVVFKGGKFIAAG